MQEVAFIMDRFGYCKLLDKSTYERNLETVESEHPHVVRCLTTDKICLFTDTGMLYQLKVTDIPMGKLRDKGTPIENISKYDGKTERILMLTSLEQIMGKKLIFATRMASVKVSPVRTIRMSQTSSSPATRKSVTRERLPPSSVKMSSPRSIKNTWNSDGNLRNGSSDRISMTTVPSSTP